MLKRISIISLSLLAFLVLFLFFFLLNVNYLLNNPKIQKKLFNFLKENYNIELNYKRVNFNLLKKKATIENLNFKSPGYEIFLSEGKFVFSWHKFLRLNFIPKKIKIKNGYLKIFRSRKHSKSKKISQIFYWLSPFYLNAKNINIDYETSEGWVNLKDLNLILRVGKQQALYEATSKGNFFQKAVLKGRFDYKNLFSENSLTIDGLDLSYFKKVSRYGISKTSINVKSEIVLEKDTLNIAFIFPHPYLCLKKIPYKKLLKGYLEGLLVYNKSKLKISLDHIIINYPKIKGHLNLIKNKNGYQLVLNAKELSLSDIRGILTEIFPKNKKMNKFFAILNKGEFYNVKLKTAGKNLKDLVKMENLSIKALLNKGKVKISKLPFDFEDIKGDIVLKNRVLFFKGVATVEKNTELEIKTLRLDFNRKPLYLYVKGNFYSSAGDFIDVVEKILKKSEYFKSYKFKGSLRGEVVLSGEVPKIKGKIKVYPENVFIKTPYYKKLISIKNGVLIYDFNKLIAKNLKVFSQNFQIDKLECIFNIKNFNLTLQGRGAHFNKNFVKEISNKNKKLKNFIKKYQITFDRVNIRYLEYKENLGYLKKGKGFKKDYLRKDITAKGEVIKFFLKFPYKKSRFNLFANKLNFTYQRGKLFINKSLINLEKSIFEIKGEIDKKRIVIEGKGRLDEEFKNKLKGLFPALRRVALVTPIKFNRFKLIYENGTYYYSGSHSIKNSNIFVNLNKNEKHFEFNLSFLDKNSNFIILFKQNSLWSNLILKGIIDLDSLARVFTFKNNKICGRLEVSLKLDISKNIAIKNFDELIKSYFNSKIILHNSYIKFINFKYFLHNSSIFTLNLRGHFTKDKLKVTNFMIKSDAYCAKGSFDLIKNENFLYLNGKVLSKELNLKKLKKKKKKKFKGGKKFGELKKMKDIFSILNNVPLIADLKFYIEKLILPTSHKLERINGRINFDNINKTLIVDIPDISFCNLNMQAMYERILNRQYTFIEILPSQGDFLDLFSCLYPEEMPKVIVEGPYTLKGYFYAEGDKNNLFKKNVGTLEVHSNHGYIYRAPLLARIFVYLSPIDLFRGKIPNLENKLLEYDELDIKALINNGTLKIDNGFLSALGFRLFSEGTINLFNKKLRLIFYISPFKTADVIIEKIPYLGKWILGKPRMLVYLPLEVTGTYEKYKIIPLHPSSVGKGVFDFVFRILGISEEFFKEASHIKELKE